MSSSKLHRSFIECFVVMHEIFDDARNFSCNLPHGLKRYINLKWLSTKLCVKRLSSWVYRFAYHKMEFLAASKSHFARIFSWRAPRARTPGRSCTSRRCRAGCPRCWSPRCCVRGRRESRSWPTLKKKRIPGRCYTLEWFYAENTP